MRKFVVAFGILVCLTPRILWAAELADCDVGTAQCACPPTVSLTDLAIDEATLTVSSDCFTACYNLRDASSTYEGITSYNLQCNVGGVLTTISQGDLTLTDVILDASYGTPPLGVEIPGLVLEDTTKTGNTIQSTVLGQYIGAVYAWLISAGALVAIVMIMIGGLQYALAHGDKGKIDKGKKRITNAFTGMLLLMFAYTIAFLIDPNTTRFETLSLEYVEPEDFPPWGEDLDMIPFAVGGDASAVTDIGGDHIELATSDAGLDPEAVAALQIAATQFFATTGGSLRVTSAYRSIEKQQELYAQNCSSGSCSPATCDVGNPAETANCPHTSAIAADTWYSGSPGSFKADPARMQQVAEAMIGAGFCRLGAEVWHFELNSKHVSSSCSTSNISPTYTVHGTTYVPTAGCTSWDFKNHVCSQ